MPVSKLNYKRNDEAGFQLIEVGVVVVAAMVVGVLSLIVFGKVSARYQLRSKAQSMAWQIERARAISIKNNQTLTLGFTSQNKVLDLTCGDCKTAKEELPPFNLPNDVMLSAYPTLTIRGDGTISPSSIIALDDGKHRQVTITISNAGRIIVGNTVEFDGTY